MANIIPKSIDNLIDQSINPLARGFVQFVLLKLGLSEEIMKVKNVVAAEKVSRRWQIEAPKWILMEAKKLERQYDNLGKVMIKSAGMITATESKITEDNDVFWGLLEHSKEVSNEQMQDLISRIIAGEYNNPGTYSMSTLQVLRSLGKNELALFERIGSLLIGKRHLPMILFTGNQPASKIVDLIKIDFEDLQKLQGLNIFLPNSMTQTLQNPEKKKILIQYFDKNFFYELVNGNIDASALFPSFYGLTIAGKQILNHLSPKYIDDYYVWIKENYFELRNPLLKKNDCETKTCPRRGVWRKTFDCGKFFHGSQLNNLISQQTVDIIGQISVH
ncbi:MAG: DUF2806 domain-containing protein [Candidatus Nealsonbacteria bacterium DGGOD1a]|nr:MAG: DUF2806 domain-containing protein [Candidatus Nealsonbacteria bacterium DGGOD1a]